MRKSELDFYLPDSLIAQKPLLDRSASRLLVVDRTLRTWSDRKFSELDVLLNLNDKLVLNDTRVLPAKFSLRRYTGGMIEGLFLDVGSDGNWHVLLRGASKVRIGEALRFDRCRDYEAILLQRHRRGKCVLEVAPEGSIERILDAVGQTPLPPYIKRSDLQNELSDRDRYQTVYAQKSGAVAAPTAGLHFDAALLNRLQTLGIGIVPVTLHVGAGTFQPLEAESLRDHVMHHERYEVRSEHWDAIKQHKKSGGRIVAVGTTSARTLEAIANGGPLKGETNLFIYPPYEFQMVDALLTNFHLPQSTLLALVYAFGGTELMQAAYQHAVKQKYRFFSYGDAMLIV